MVNQQKKWQFYSLCTELADSFSRELGISTTIAQLLINRGITDLAAARKFLFDDAVNLPDPFLLKDMGKAVERIIHAIQKQEQITVYGDYDVDGITACSLLCKTLKRLGAMVDYYIPERQSEGYGLNIDALTTLQRSGTRLLITVDCGISSFSEVSACQNILDIIITDHHQPPALLPPAYAIINPKQPDCPYPEKQLAGVGVAFKLCQALWQQQHSDVAPFTDDLELVAVGTVADIVPLQGENRTLVKAGLAALSDTANLGLQALKEVCGLTGKPINSGHVAFTIGPRLNAAGRVGLASAGVELLLTTDAAVAQRLAQQLNQENSNRQAIEKEILLAAEDELKQVDVQAAKVLVVAGEGWHSGVIGIVASRLVDKYYRPVVIISVEQGIGKGSCRSIAGFDMVQALTECQDLLIKFGGHRQAAGLTIAASHIPELRRRLEAIAAVQLSAADYIPLLKIDCDLPLTEINSALLEELSVMAPHGQGNPSPLFAGRAIALADVRTLGQQQQHLKLQLHTGAKHTIRDVVAWNMGPLAGQLQDIAAIDLVFLPQYNEWKGKKTIQLQAKDLRSIAIAQTDQCPDRAMVGWIYLTLKEINKQPSGNANILALLIGVLREKYKVTPSVQTLCLGLQILMELDLIAVEPALAGDHGELLIQLLPPPAEKRDLKTSPTFCNRVMTSGALFTAPSSVQIKENEG